MRNHSPCGNNIFPSDIEYQELFKNNGNDISCDEAVKQSQSFTTSSGYKF
jgi:hypothetical protein